MANKIMKSFRFSADSIAIMEFFAQHYDLTITEVIEFALVDYAYYRINDNPEYEDIIKKYKERLLING